MMPKPISAADRIPTLLAMVMLDRRLSLLAAPQSRADGAAGDGDASSPLLDAFLDARDEHDDRRANVGREATA